MPPHFPPWIRRSLLVAFVLYAVALFTATHWPELQLPEGDVPRPDLYVHFAVFGLWTILLGLSGLMGDIGCRRALLKTALVAGIYSAIDEGLQAIPWLRRHAVLDDLAANLGGVLLGVIALLIVGRFLSRRDRALPSE